ncbi:hypothetical protein [Sulfurisphaera tokodaii]|uniref:Uncharacterized protein n=2 Tax=Sulfurisphaera tokodaii TaxID=111955 RepID=F9VP92_SULTO|nr:hypothetical protein [Sulfurisphaera tokodaii]BAK54739.1 hypothetical protein STK_21240 [Sulfurisphaera tokodaii str. 7]HII72957.1 hypothetical protein [Sulfurisphaera tokodaii]
MKPILLGIPGLSYSSFMKCNPRFLMMLFSSTFRGVVVNKELNYHPTPAWLSILQMEYVKTDQFLTNVPELKLAKLTNSVLINIPITNPTYGEVNLPYNNSLSTSEEIEKVKKAIFEYIDDYPVIVSVNAIDRILLNDGKESKCEIYKIIDGFVKEVINKVEDFILFSPYGEPKENGIREQYGIYLASVPRPNEHDTVKLPEIGKLFLGLVGR